MQDHFSISTSIRRWLTLPAFDDEDQGRAAALFNTFILTFVALWLGVLATQIALGVQNPRNGPLGFITCMLLLAVREIARRGHVLLATVLFCTLTLLSLSLVVYNTGTVNFMGIATMTICVVVPTLLIGRRMGLAFLIATDASIIALYQAELEGKLPAVMMSTLTPVNQWLVFTATIIFHWILVGAARNSMVEVLMHSRKELVERRRIEEDLHWSEQRFRKTLDNIIEGCQIIDPAWRYVYTNEAAARQGIYKPEELIDHTIMEIYPGIEETDLFKILQRSMEERISNRMETEFEFPDGSIRWFDLWIQPVPDGLLILSIDITARKQAEETLRQSEQRYRVLFEDMPIAILEEDLSELKKHLDILKEQGITDFHAYFESHPETLIECESKIRVLDVNNAALRMYGANTKEELLKAMEMEPTGAELEQTRGALIGLSEGKLNHTWEGPDETMTSDPIEINMAMSVSPGYEKDYSRVIITTIDITQRKQVEKALRESEERLRFVMAATQDAVYDWDIRSGQVFRNEAYQMLFSPHEPVGTDETWWENQMHPDDRKRIMESLTSTFQERKQTWSGEYRFRRHDGTYASVIDRGFVIYDDKGQPIRMIGAILDFTERKHAEERLHRQNERLAFLHQITLNLLEQNNPDDLAQTITEEASQLLDTDVGYLALVEGGWLVGRARVPHDSPDQMRAVRLDENQSVMQQVINSREPVITTDFSTLPNLRTEVTETEVKAGILFPLLSTNTCEGVLSLGRIRSNKSFSEEDVYLGGLFARVAGLTLDNSQLRESLRQEAIRDPLTGLFNRRFMKEALTRELSRAKRNALPLAVAMLDLDHFKRINDTFGHDTGDETLRQLGSLLQTGFRGSDIVCRYGGEEFTLILPDVSLADALERMEILRGDVKRMAIQHSGETLSQLSISIGISIYPEHGSSSDTLLRAADEALYRAKQGGRDQVIVAATR